MPNIAGFWSYVHEDDENDGGAMVRLADRVMEEYALLSGETLKLFVDRDIEWGDEWKRRIDEALQETTFFIPVITPRYFKSDECRRELIKFRSASEEFGVEQLLLPIYYVEVPGMEVEEPDDKLMAMVKAIQRVDLRDIRLKNETDAEHRTIVNGLASRILRIATETEAEAAVPKSTASVAIAANPGTATSAASEGGGPDDEAGFLEVLAAGEQTLPQWSETIQAFGEELQVINEATEQTTAEIKSEDERGGGTFASRLATASRLAKRLEPPADRLTSLGQEYAEQLITIDPAIQTLIRLARENEELRRDKDAVRTFREIRDLAKSSQKATGELMVLGKVMDENSGMSRELRRPLRTIQTALRNVSDGQDVVVDWERQIDELLEEDDDASGAQDAGSED
jgi:hypothetical protein